MDAALADTRSRRRRWLRASSIVVGCAALALALSGCLKIDMAMSVNSDNTVDGSVVMAVDKAMLTMGGQSPEEAFSEMATEAPFPTAAEDGGSVTSEVYDQDGKYGKRFIFTGMPLSSFDDDDFTIKRDGDYFVLDATMDMSGTSGTDDGTEGSGIEGAEQLTQALAAGFDIRVAVTFPGEVVEHNGTLDGTTVTWTPKAGEQVVMSAKARAQGGGGSSLVLLGVGGLVVIAAVVVGLLLLMRRRNAAPAATGDVAAEPPADGPPAPTPPA